MSGMSANYQKAPGGYLGELWLRAYTRDACIRYPAATNVKSNRSSVPVLTME